MNKKDIKKLAMGLGIACVVGGIVWAILKFLKK